MGTLLVGSVGEVECVFMVESGCCGGELLLCSVSQRYLHLFTCLNDERNYSEYKLHTYQTFFIGGNVTV